jgi:solute carrier family 66, member 2
MAQLLLDAALVTLPAVGYGFQYRRIQLEKRDTFSTYVSLVLIVSNVLRLFFYWLAPFDVTFAVQAVVMVAVQLALVELITRVRREQRMLPSTLFLRISWRFKDLQRYFWQWDDFLSYVLFLAAFSAVMVPVCLVGQFVPWFAESLGLVSLGLEAMQGMPQLVRNRQEGVGVEGLSWVLVGAWLVGDVAKSIYFALHAQLPRQFLVGGVIQVGVDLVIVYQMWAYRRRYKDHSY